MFVQLHIDSNVLVQVVPSLDLQLVKLLLDGHHFTAYIVQHIAEAAYLRLQMGEVLSDKGL